MVVSESPLLRLGSATGAPSLRLLGMSQSQYPGVHCKCYYHDACIYRLVDWIPHAAKKSFNKDADCE